MEEDKKNYSKMQGRTGAQLYEEFKRGIKLQPKPFLKAIPTDEFGHRIGKKEEASVEKNAEENFCITILLKSGQNVSKLLFL